MEGLSRDWSGPWEALESPSSMLENARKDAIQGRIWAIFTFFDEVTER